MRSARFKKGDKTKVVRHVGVADGEKPLDMKGDFGTVIDDETYAQHETGREMVTIRTHRGGLAAVPVDALEEPKRAQGFSALGPKGKQTWERVFGTREP